MSGQDSFWRIGPRGFSVVALILVAAVLNYVDRQALALLKPTLDQRFGFGDAGYASIVNAFLITYTLSFLVSGRVIDRIGPRAGIAWCLGFWSLANAGMAFATSIDHILISRALLGLGEAGLWVAVPRLAAERYLPRTRGIVLGLATMGATIGATIAPPLVVALAGDTGEHWTWAFLATGLMGLAVVPLWWLVCPPSPSATEATKTPALGTLAVLRLIVLRREVWLLILTRLITDPVWYFYQSWFPTFLHQKHGWSQADIKHAWFVYLPADLGCLLGGFLAAWRIGKGIEPHRGRLQIMLFCCLLTPLSAVVALSGSQALVLAASMFVIGAHLAWLANVSALTAELLPPAQTATVFGIVAAASATGGILMNSWIGAHATGDGMVSFLIIAACVHPLAWILCAVLGRRWSTSSP
ncbi:hexuronate transporter [Planctomycetota bacterium]|nr:hexuronate transporter [Planctomycetota bacterium]